MASVSLNNVSKRYSKSDELSVKGISLDIADREFMVLVGPSGCGKSTTLRMIAGLEQVSEGQVYIGSQLVNHVPPKKRDIAMVFQNYALYPNMSVFENLAFGLRLRKAEKNVLEAAVKSTSRTLEIEHLLERRPGQLSGGQRQRVALGRAILRQPQVFLMDEPLSNLDAKLRVQMREEIIQLHRRLETTFIYVTHDQVEAMTMGTRICIMKDGHILQVDTPENVYRYPANRFVASFIGSPPMNFLDGAIVDQGKLIFDTPRFSLDVPSELWPALREQRCVGRKIVLGIRPENLRLYRASDGPEDALAATVSYSELMGADRYIHLELGEQKLVVRAGADERFAAAEEVRLKLNPQALRFFHAEHGAAIR